MKRYKAVFFDWDGTAVTSRKASPNPVIEPMKALLHKGIPLVIVSGTTYENIAGGKLHTRFAKAELAHLFLGLGRGAYNYRFDGQGRPEIWKSLIPSPEKLLTIHQVCFDIHQKLLGEYGMRTDIIFSRPNYCKIDLMVDAQRGDKLFLHSGEIEALELLLATHHFEGGLPALIRLSRKAGEERGLELSATCDAKYLEVGVSNKGNNVDCALESLAAQLGIQPGDCCFWGDEYVALCQGCYGSDSLMITRLSRDSDHFDVFPLSGDRPEGVQKVGGGPEAFHSFLRLQSQ